MPITLAEVIHAYLGDTNFQQSRRWSVRTLISGIAPQSQNGTVTYSVQYGHLTNAILWEQEQLAFRQIFEDIWNLLEITRIYRQF